MPEALIWGASGGIGGALVTLLKREGWRAFAAARDESRIPAEADLAVHFEAASLYSSKEAAMRVAYETTSLDLVVYAAGGIVAGTVEGLGEGEWAAVIDANLTGAARAAQVSLPLLREGGQMMFIGAYVDRISLPKFAAYAAAKAGLEPLLTILGKEHRKQKFTLVRPGAVDTPFWNQVPFTLPKNAIQPAAVAEAMLARYHEGQGGVLDL
jgi:NAD(P)-dependent dehydrogenase (short-subunit alcohol dehydrogenase family)